MREFGKNYFNIVLDHIQTDTGHIPNQFLQADFLHQQVADGLAERLSELNVENRTHQTVISDHNEIPFDLLGLPLQVKKVEFDSQGYINLYMEYGASAR